MAKASRILDLYERVFEGEPLKDDEFVLPTDEKISIQVRARRHPTLPPKPGDAMIQIEIYFSILQRTF